MSNVCLTLFVVFFAVLAAASGAPTQQVIHVTAFSGSPNCSGNTTTTTYISNQCVTFASKKGIYSSGMISCPKPMGQCLSFYAHAGPKCNNYSMFNTVQCDKCMKSTDPNIGNFMFQCFEDRFTAQAYDQCNDDCSMCKKSVPMQLGVCAETNDGYFLPSFIEECPRPRCAYFFPGEGPNCANATSRIASECGKCNQDAAGNYYVFNCDMQTASTQCNADCTTCAGSKTVLPQTCVPYDNGMKSIFIDEYAACGGVEYLFPDSKCMSTTGIEYAFQMDKCTNGRRVSCKVE